MGEVGRSLFEGAAVLCGPPLAGKSTLLLLIAKVLQARVTKLVVPFAAPPGVEQFAIRVTTRIDDRTVELLTISGGIWDNKVWLELLARCETWLLVLDPLPTRKGASRQFIELVDSNHHIPLPGAVIVTKADLVSAKDRSSLTSLLAGTRLALCDVHEARIDDPQQIWSTLQSSLGLAKH